MLHALHIFSGIVFQQSQEVSASAFHGKHIQTQICKSIGKDQEAVSFMLQTRAPVDFSVRSKSSFTVALMYPHFIDQKKKKDIKKKIIILKQGDWAHCKSEMISQILIWYKTSKPLDSVELCRLKSDEDVVHHIQQLRAHTVLQAYFLNSIIQPMLIKYYGHEKACCYYLYLLCLAHTIYSVLYRKKTLKQ